MMFNRRPPWMQMPWGQDTYLPDHAQDAGGFGRPQFQQYLPTGGNAPPQQVMPMPTGGPAQQMQAPWMQTGGNQFQAPVRPGLLDRLRGRF